MVQYSLLRPAVRLYEVGAGEELSMNRANAPCQAAGVLEISDLDRAIVALGDVIDEAVAVGGTDLKPGMTARQFRRHWRQICGTEDQRYGDAQPTRQVAGGLDDLPRRIDFGTHSRYIVSKFNPSFRQRGAPGGRAKKLHAKPTGSSRDPPASATSTNLRGSSVSIRCSLFRDADGNVQEVPHHRWRCQFPRWLVVPAIARFRR